jgi:hypothetical protein
MAKKKEEKTPADLEPTASAKDIAELKAKLKEHDELLGRIKLGIQALETMVLQLKERNRLR